MSAELLKSYMNRTGKNEIDIAAALKVHPVTISRYLKGQRVQRIVQAALERLLSSEPAESDDSNTAVG